MQSIVKVPYVNLVAQNASIKDELISAISNVLESGQFIHGKEVRGLERSFAELCGARFAMGVNSGTDALIMALRALGIGEGDEVITVANSYVTTASCIACVGAKPVFIDVKDDYMMDPALL
ncbi:MAG: DegT/DnrJ/EryC1/StrS family aminotransferase, partial [Spirochaetes bacterium]|nr:DegT/DnrJ/EryC1/StrS family aminotransferase [Spirochaetota bacterium]